MHLFPFRGLFWGYYGSARQAEYSRRVAFISGMCLMLRSWQDHHYRISIPAWDERREILIDAAAKARERLDSST